MAIAAGLSVGDWVVTDRTDRLTEDARVEVVETYDASISDRKVAPRGYGKKGVNP